jgi:hypothetical protein
VTQVGALLAAAGLPRPSPDLDDTARMLLSLGGRTWHCPGLPWTVDAPSLPALQLDVRLRLRPASGHAVQLQPEAVALLLALGAFDGDLPPLVRRRPGALAGDDQPTVRLTALEAVGPAAGPDSMLETQLEAPLRAIGALSDHVAVISFDIDDQSPEDLATGLDLVRAEAGVLSVVWTAAGGKKGRPSFAIEVLARPEEADRAILACLRETSTIGLRWRLEQRVLLARQAGSVTTGDGRTARTKTVTRPGGQYTTKAESDDIAHGGVDWADRSSWRAELESRGRR